MCVTPPTKTGRPRCLDGPLSFLDKPVAHQVAEISEAILPLPDICVAALRLRAERQTPRKTRSGGSGRALTGPLLLLHP